MPADPQIQNALVKEIQKVAELYDTVFKLKENRGLLDALGVSAMNDAAFDAAITENANTSSASKGDLSHLTAGKIRRLLAAMDALDNALLTPVSLDGVTMSPFKAIVDVIR